MRQRIVGCVGEEWIRLCKSSSVLCIARVLRRMDVICGCSKTVDIHVSLGDAVWVAVGVCGGGSLGMMVGVEVEDGGAQLHISGNVSCLLACRGGEYGRGRFLRRRSGECVSKG